MKSKLWSRNVIQKLVFISLLIEHASVSKNKENEDMHAAWASPCRALTYAAGDRSTSASTSRWRVRHWLGDQCWFAGPGLPVLSALVLHTRFWDACPESPVLGILSWFTYPESRRAWPWYQFVVDTLHLCRIKPNRYCPHAEHSLASSLLESNVFHIYDGICFLFLRTMRGFRFLTQHVPWYMLSSQGIALQWSNNTV